MRATSEIFNAYAQIALDQGLISEEGLTSTAEDKTNPRYDTHTLSDIEILYGVQPNGKDDDILDKAHPTPLIIAPAYDRVNGLVENLKERHNIMVGIVQKPNNGLLTQHRYIEARQNLLNEVIKVGFLLDRNDEQELMVLADTCSDRIVKTALVPLAIAGIIAGIIALTAGGAAMYTSNNPKSQGIKQDALRTLTELEEAFNDYSQLKAPLEPVTENVRNLAELADAFISYNDQIVSSLLRVSSATTPEAKRSAIAQNAANLFKSGKDKDILNVLQKFKEVCDAITAAAPEAIHYLMKAKDKYETGDSQIWRSMKDLWQDNVLNSDSEDAAKMLAVLAKSVTGVSGSITEQISKLNTLREQVGQVAETSTDSKPVEITPEKPAKPKSVLPTWG